MIENYIRTVVNCGCCVYIWSYNMYVNRYIYIYINTYKHTYIHKCMYCHIDRFSDVFSLQISPATRICCAETLRQAQEGQTSSQKQTWEKATFMRFWDHKWAFSRLRFPDTKKPVFCFKFFTLVIGTLP